MIDKLEKLLKEKSILGTTTISQNKIELKDGESRIVSILFADIKGFTSLSEKIDNEVLQELLDTIMKGFSEKISKYDGYVDKYEGDRIMAHFGSKKAHENDTRRAVLAGFELIEVVEAFNKILPQLDEFSHVSTELGIRVGINTGLVTTGKVGRKWEGDFTVYGDAVNIASRMEENGVLNRIMLTEKTMFRIKQFFNVSRHELLLVKGKSEPILTYLVDSPIQDVYSSRVKSRSLFVGREKELKILEDVFRKKSEMLKANVHESNDIPDITIVGIKALAGMGKSRIVSEYIHKINDKYGSYIIEAKTPSLIQPPYSLFISMFRTMFLIQKNDDEETAKQKIMEFCSEIEKSLTASEKESLSLSYPIILFLLGYQIDDERVQNNGEELRLEININILKFLHIYCLYANKNSAPLLIVFEDIHWLDESSEQALNFMISKLKNDTGETKQKINLVILLSYRIGYKLSSKISNFQSFREIVLDKLSDVNIHKLIEHNPLSSSISKQIRNRLLIKAHGNPFYIEEWMKLLDGTEDLTDNYANNIPIPESINSIILTRIDRLGQTAREFLQKAGVVGFNFDKRVISILEKKLENESVNEGLIGNLISEETIFPVNNNQTKYEFKHQVIHDVIYNTILRRNRRTLHKLVAEIIEEEYKESLKDHYFALAFHFEIAAIKDKTVLYLEKSEKIARDVFMNDKAIKLNFKLLDFVTDIEKNCVYLRLLKIYLDVGNLKEAEKVSELIDITGIADNNSIDDYYLQKTRLLLDLNKFVEAKEFFESTIGKYSKKEAKLHAEIMEMNIKWNSLELIDFETSGQKLLKEIVEIGNDNLLVKLVLLMGFFYSKKADYKQALEFFHLGLEKAEENKLILLKLYQNIGSCFSRIGQKDKALINLKKALSIGRLINDVGGCCKLANDIAGIYQSSEEYEKSLRMYKESFESAELLGDAKQMGLVLYNIAFIFFLQEDFDQAVTHLEKSKKISNKISDYSGLSFSNDLLGDIMYRKGEYTKAEEIYLENLDFQKKIQDNEGLAHTYGNLGNIAIEKKEFDEAERCYKLQMQMLSEIGDIEGEGKAWFNWALLDLDLKKKDEAVTKLNKALKLFEKGKLQMYIDIVNKQIEKISS